VKKYAEETNFSEDDDSMIRPCKVEEDVDIKI